MAHTVINNKFYVDSDFLNSLGGIPGVSLEHMGFGEFYAKTPMGTVDFDRMRGKDFPGQGGRSHQAYDREGYGTKATEWLLDQVEKLGKSVRVASDDASLRSRIIRLAAVNPELRADILPLLKEAAGPSYKDYADRKRNKGEKPLAQDAWESRVMGKGEKPQGKAKSVSVGGKTFAHEDMAGRRHEIYDAAAAMQKSVGGAGKHPEVDTAFNALGRVLDDIKNAGKNGGDGAEHASKLDKAHKALSTAVSKVKDKTEAKSASVGGKTASLRSGLIRLAYANPDLREHLLPLVKEAAAVQGPHGDAVVPPEDAPQVGDILVSSWGYDQTNIDFYEVRKVTGSMVVIQKLQKRVVRDLGAQVYVVPVPGQYGQAAPLRRKFGPSWRGDSYSVGINSYASASKWDGVPLAQTGVGYGH